MQINITIGLALVGFVLGSFKLGSLCKSSCKSTCETGASSCKIVGVIFEILKAILITALDAYFQQQHIGFASCVLGTSVSYIWPGLACKIVGLLTGMFIYLSFIS